MNFFTDREADFETAEGEQINGTALYEIPRGPRGEYMEGATLRGVLVGSLLISRASLIAVMGVEVVQRAEAYVQRLVQDAVDTGSDIEQADIDLEHMEAA